MTSWIDVKKMYNTSLKLIRNKLILNYAKIRDNYMQVYNKQNKDNCI